MDPTWHDDQPQAQEHLKVVTSSGAFGFLTFHEDDPESLEWKAFKLKEANSELRVFVYDAHEEEETVRFAYRELVDIIVPEPEL